MVNINSVLKQELERVSLPKGEICQLKKQADEIVRKISLQGVGVRIGGSLAKDTLIKKDIQDADIFVVFKNEEEVDDLEKILKGAGLAGKKVHGSRDYFQIKKGSVLFEIVPVVKISKPEEAQNITDVSLMHVDYVKKKIRKNKKLADEIKLAKVFCYAQDCYGAESYIQGFSGYALEVLVCYFGGFVKFLKGIFKKKVIDPERYFKNGSEVMRELNESKLQSPVILVDPTYKYRNACAGLSAETFDKFSKCAKKFLKSPSLSVFEKEKLDIDKVKKSAKQKKAEFFEIGFETGKQEGDIAATKMKKFFNFLCREFERKQQKVLIREFVYSGGQTAKGYLAVKEKKEIEVGGVEIKRREAVRNFKRVRNKTYTKNGKVYAKEKVSLKEIFEGARRAGEEMGVEFRIL